MAESNYDADVVTAVTEWFYWEGRRGQSLDGDISKHICNVADWVQRLRKELSGEEEWERARHQGEELKDFMYEVLCEPDGPHRFQGRRIRSL